MNSIEKAATALKTLGEPPYRYSLTEMSERLGCGKSGAFKILGVLCQFGLIEQTSDYKYTLGISSYMLGKCYETNIGLEKFIRPYLVRIRDLTGESAAFATTVSGRPTTIYREDSTKTLRTVSSVGEPRPINAGAVGKTLSAYEDEAVIREKLLTEKLAAYTSATITDPEKLLLEYAKIREQGYAVSDGEYSADTVSIGVPVMNGAGGVLGALVLTAPRSRITQPEREKYTFMLKQFSSEISNRLKMTPTAAGQTK